MLVEEFDLCELAVSDQDIFDEVASKHSANACQVRAGNSCGSGSYVGDHDDGSLVLTNAHVTSNRIGTSVTLRFNFGQGDVTKTGRVIMAAYSNRIVADWAIVFIPGWKPPVSPAWCSRAKPAGQFATTGAPSCTWPLRHQSPLNLLSNNNAGFVVWDKPAIPGQSGSAVWSLIDHWQRLLLTWRTGNGNGAGQPLDWIYRQANTAIQTGVLLGGAMPDGLIPLGNVHPDCIEGFESELSIRDLKIWAEDQVQPDPGPGPDPDPQPGGDFAAAIAALIRARDQINSDLKVLVPGAIGSNGIDDTFGL